MNPLYFQTLQDSKKNMNDSQMYNMIFTDLLNSNYWGFGNKRITIHQKNSITEKVPFSGFGYKDKNNVLYVGIRMWLDQGDYSKLKEYDKRYTIVSHFVSLLNEFDYEYGNKLLNIN